MRVQHVPTLERMREVYRLPHGPERFQTYLAAVDDERLLPLSAFNPMARAPVIERVEQLIALGAEELAAVAGQKAAARLSMIEADLLTGLALADDLAGGWTNRWQIEGPRLGDRLDVRRDGSGHPSGELGQWVTGLLWASDGPSREGLERTVRGALYRRAHDERFGVPHTLGDFMLREGRVHLFAGGPKPVLGPDDIAYTREVIAPVRDTPHQPTAFAAWWGDEIARSVGLAPLGLSRGAGRALALAEASGDPLAALTASALQGVSL